MGAYAEYVFSGCWEDSRTVEAGGEVGAKEGPDTRGAEEVGAADEGTVGGGL